MRGAIRFIAVLITLIVLLGPIELRAGDPNADKVLTIPSPEASLAALTTAEGYQVNLYASEAIAPLYNPIGMTIDPVGRIWVITSPTYPHYDPGVKPKDQNERIEALLGDDTVIDNSASLGALSAEVFLGNLPDATLSASAKGKEGPDLDTVSERVVQFNEMLDIGAAQYPNIHVIDLYGWVEALPDGQVQVGDTTLSTDEFGGLLSLDGVHLTDTGYGLIAEEFIVAINEVVGTDIPLPDLEQILATDDRRPEALMDGGLDGTQCD